MIRLGGGALAGTSGSNKSAFMEANNGTSPAKAVTLEHLHLLKFVLFL